MKKVILSVLFCTLISLFCFTYASASDPVSSGECGGGITWTLDTEGTLTISGEDAMPDWNFPEGVPWALLQDEIKTVIIQPGVTHIGRYSFYNCRNLLSISIPDSVTSIEQYAFHYSGYYYESSNWNNNVLYVGNCLITARSLLSGYYTVRDCTVLLAAGAFSDCSDLTGIALPDSVKHIGSDAFFGCINLADITLPDAIIDIGESAFTDTKYYSDEDNLDGGVLYLGSCLLKADPELSGVYEIKSGTRSIQHQAFYNCTQLTGVIMPDSVTFIGTSAFKGCTGLEAISFSNEVEIIGESAFSGCSVLGDITFPEKLKSIGEWAFSSCIGLKRVSIPPSVESIGSGAFAYCESIEKIELSEGLKEIGSDAFWCGALYVGNLTIPSTVEHIGNMAFAPCWRLTSIDVRPGNARYHSSGNCLIDTETGALLLGSSTSVIPDDGSVTSISDHAFNANSYLRKINIPESVTSIELYAFEDCYNLYDISLPDGLTLIGSNAFDGSGYFNRESNWEDDVLYCGKYLLSARTTLSGAYSVKDGTTLIAGGAFTDCTGLTQIDLPDSIIGIGRDAFRNTGLSEIFLPPQVSVIEPYTFSDCINLKNMHIHDGIKQIKYNAFAECVSLTDIFIPGSVETIEEHAFWLNPNLEHVVLSDGIKSIEAAAFWGCSIKHLEIPNSLTDIGDRVFCNCSSLESVVIPPSVKSIHSLAFLNCSSLTDIIYIGTPEQKAAILLDEEKTIDENSGKKMKDVHWNYISSDTYYSVSTGACEHGTVSTNQRYFGAGDICTLYGSPHPGYRLSAFLVNGARIDGSTFAVTEDSIVSAEFELFRPDVEIIDSGVFDGNSSAIWFLYADGELVIDGFGQMSIWGFRTPWDEHSKNITRVLIGSGITSIGNMVFSGCTNLSDIEIPVGVTSIGDSAFSGCTSLSGIEIPVGVTSIGDSAFYRCTSLSGIEIPVGVTSIGDSAFSGCTNLSDIKIPVGVTSIGNMAFSYCTNLSDIKIPIGVTSIGYMAFSDCTSLSDIEIPVGVTSIGDYAFYRCTSLSGIEIPVGVTNIGNLAFYDCTSLSDIKIPIGVTSIGDYAFSGCTSLSSIEIPVGVTSIGANAFSYCTNLSDIKIPVGVTSIGDSAFYRCTSLRRIFIPASVTAIGQDAFDYCYYRLTIYGYPDSSAESCAASESILFKSLDDPAVLKSLIDPDNEAADIVIFADDDVRTIPAGGQALAAVYDGDGRFTGMAQAVVLNYRCYALLDETQLNIAFVRFFVLDDDFSPVYEKLTVIPAL